MQILVWTGLKKNYLKTEEAEDDNDDGEKALATAN